MMGTLLQDLRHGFRVLGKNPGSTAIGVVSGIGLALMPGRVLETVLYGVSPSDPITFLIVAAGLGVAVLAAAYIPARRARMVDPLVALRCE